MRKAQNAGLTKLGFKEIRENQRKVVEAYVSGRDVLMVAPTGPPRCGFAEKCLHIICVSLNSKRMHCIMPRSLTKNF